MGSTSEFGYARVVTIKLNQWTHTATLVASDNEPQGGVATSQGNGQRLPGGTGGPGGTGSQGGPGHRGHGGGGPGR